MDRAGVRTSRRVLCPECEAELDRHDDPGSAGARARCPRCGAEVAAGHGTREDRPRPRRRAEPGAAARRFGAGLAQLGVAAARRGCTGSERSSGSLILLVCGGFVPVARGWLRDEIDGWSDVVGALGGVWFAVETNDPDSDLGPVLARVDAPLLFATIEKVGRRLGVKPPSQVRLTYLPCCGVVAWGRSRALLDRAPALSGAHPGRAEGHRRARAGSPGQGRRHGGGSLGPVCRGTRAGRRAKRPARSRSPGRLGSLLPARGVVADRARGARTGSAGRSVSPPRSPAAAPPRPPWSRSPSFNRSSAKSSRPTTPTIPAT